MAVKGKKKSQSRGSQGRRGPAHAPRAAYAHRAKEPWYRTTLGRILAGLALLLVLAITFAIVRSGSDSGDLTQRRNDLDQYTGDVRALLQAITPAASAENAVPNRFASPNQARAVKKQSASWITQLADAQKSAGEVTSPTPVTQTATILFVESIQAYSQAATIFGLAPSTSPPIQAKLLASGASLRNQATALWQEGINIVDQARAGANMDPSQLRIPTAAPVAPPAPTPSAVGTGDGGGNKKNDKDNGGGDNSK